MTSRGEPARRRGGDQLIPRPSAWRFGEPPPWSDRTPERVDLDALVHAIQARGPGQPPVGSQPGARPSAVLVALFDGPHGAEVVLTRRSSRLHFHRGEISFPGGGIDPGETPEEAALREADEEVALDPRLVTLVGELDHLATFASRNVIVPVVGTLPERPTLVAAELEVERILFVPLVEFFSADVYREERWGEPPLDRTIHFFHLDDETVWGATGRILLQLLTIAAEVAS